jgi:hypothetical protein
MALDDLVPNPFVRVVDERDNDRLVGVNVVVPVRGEGLRITSFRYSEDPALCATLLKIRAADDSVELELTDQQLQALANSGFLVPVDSLPRPVLYTCTLQDVPERVQMPAATLIINPGLELGGDGTAPADVAVHAPSFDWMFPLTRVAWVRDERTGLLAPYWLTEEEVSAIGALQAGLDPRSLDPDLLRRFVGASILVTRDATAPPQIGRSPAVLRGRVQLATRGYVLIENMLPQPHVKAMRRYYAGLLQEGMLTWGDDQVPRRFNAHNEGCAHYWHLQLASTVQGLVDEPVKPSYAYSVVYEPGAVLRKHVDRAQCEFSISLLVDYVPEPDTVSDWPLLLDLPGPPPESVAIHFGIGDGLIYYGRVLPHHRHELPEGRRSSHVFFHFVRPDFEGGLS